MAFTEIKKATAGRSANADYGVMVSVNKASKGAGRQAKQTAIRFKEEIIKELRWLAGDKVKIFFDADSGDVLVRREADGWTLTAANKCGKKRSALVGSAVACSTSVSGDIFGIGETRVLVKREHITVEKDGSIIFQVV